MITLIQIANLIQIDKIIERIERKDRKAATVNKAKVEKQIKKVTRRKKLFTNNNIRKGGENSWSP